jgi:phosphoglycolate phosphatase-like HAD superfamily hydrolase
MGGRLLLERIKAIIFDFDGVIVESANIKTQAFQSLFSQYPERLDSIVEYHIRNMGISRFVKFKYIYENILSLEYGPQEEKKLGNLFSRAVLEAILKAPFVAGAREYLGSHYNSQSFFIASGTPQEELDFIVSKLGLKQYFLEVFGSPLQKPEIIKHILAKYSLKRCEVVFIGDGQSDCLAANQTGIPFIGRITGDSLVDFSSCEWVINDLTELDSTLEAIANRG